MNIDNLLEKLWNNWACFGECKDPLTQEEIEILRKKIIEDPRYFGIYNIPDYLKLLFPDDMEVREAALISIIRKISDDEGMVTYLAYDLTSDNTIEEALEYIKEPYNRTLFIVKLSDAAKEKYIRRSKSKSEIIKSFSSDELKMKYLKTYFLALRDDERADIISTLKSDENKVKYLRPLLSPETRGKIIGSLDSMDLFFQYYNGIKNPRVFPHAIRRLEFDSHKSDEDIPEEEKDRYRIDALSKVNDPETLSLCLLHMPDYISIQYFSRLNDKQKKRVIRSFSPEYYLKALVYFKPSDVINLVMSQEIPLTVFNCDEKTLDYLINIFSTEFSVNASHLKYACNIFSLEILKYLKNKNITEILNMDDENFQKLMSLFSKENLELSVHDCDSLYETFSVYLFNKNNGQILNKYNNLISNLKESLVSNDQERLNGLKEEIKELYTDFAEVLGITLTCEELINSLLSNNEEAKTILHQMCDLYVERYRQSYVKASTEHFKDSSLRYYFEKNASIKYLMTKYSFDEAYEEMKKISGLTSEEKELLQNESLMREIYEFKQDPKGKKLSDEAKKYINKYNVIIDKLYTVVSKIPSVRRVLHGAEPPIKKIYSVSKVNPVFLIDVLSNIDAKDFCARIGKSKDGLARLKQVLGKYKYLCLDFEKIGMVYEMGDPGVFVDGPTIASLIQNFELVEKDVEALSSDAAKKGRKISPMMSHLNCADMYSSSSRVYRDIFGYENFRYIKSNVGPNSASEISSEERLKKSVKMVSTMYSRRRVAIPSSDKVYTLSNGKALNLVVGNFTNPINLTYGERTGSCMRVGGAGKLLYDACLTNDNGFHIRIVDPETGEFVSRVSGIRNGNFVILNELRTSTSPKYSDSDLCEVIEMFAKNLIEETKDSKYPIENVIISKEYAMKHSDKKAEELNCDVTDVTPNVYLDVTDTAVVLATTGEELRPGLGRVEYYPVQRDKVTKAKNPNESVRHIEAVEQLLLGKKVDKINIPEMEYVECYCGEDWYIAVDREGKMHTKIMKGIKDKKLPMKEMQEVLGRLKTQQDKLEDDEERGKSI